MLKHIQISPGKKNPPSNLLLTKILLNVIVSDKSRIKL